MADRDIRVGVEVGGTFTDLVVIRDGAIEIAKVPSTPQQPDVGALNAIDAAGLKLSAITDLVHGSTVATNAVLERKGGRIAALVTEPSVCERPGYGIGLLSWHCLPAHSAYVKCLF